MEPADLHSSIVFSLRLISYDKNTQRALSSSAPLYSQLRVHNTTSAGFFAPALIILIYQPINEAIIHQKHPYNPEPWYYRNCKFRTKLSIPFYKFSSNLRILIPIARRTITEINVSDIQSPTNLLQFLINRFMCTRRQFQFPLFSLSFCTVSPPNILQNFGNKNTNKH